MRTLLSGLALCVALLLPGSPASAQVLADTVDVTPANDTLIIYNSLSLQARVVDSLGRPSTRAVTWAVRDTSAIKPIRTERPTPGLSVVTIWAKSDSGRSYIVATVGAKKDSGLVVVRDTICDPAVLATLNLIPDSAVVRRTDSIGVAAFPRSQCGNLLDGQNVVWSSSDSTDMTITRLDSLFGRIVVLDSAGGPDYIKGVLGSLRDSVKVKQKTAP